MTAQLLLVRHAAHADLGHALSGRGGGGLTDRGRRQAERLATALADHFRLAAVYASPRRRAVATAECIAAPLGLATVIEPGLDEIDFGRWTGLAFAALEGNAEWDRWNRARAEAAPPAGERMKDAVARIVATLQGIASRHEGETVAAVSHADMIRGAIAHYLGLSLDHILRFEISPASVSRLELGNGGARILSINETAA
ncbi:MAG TPA: histidine phosphatase family protein [Sphingomonadales bacterium]